MNNTHRIKTQQSPFEKLKQGSKTIDLRVNDEKRQKIEIGDIAEFVNINSNPEETLLCKVVNLHKFSNFKELYKSLPLLKCGYTEENIKTANPSDMEQYYSVEEIDKYGVVGIEVERI